MTALSLISAKKIKDGDRNEVSVVWKKRNDNNQMFFSIRGRTIDDLSLYINQLKCRVKRRLLKNKDFTLICSNCTGGVMLKDLGVRFNSPFINLWISGTDYVKMLRDLQGYMDEPLTFDDNSNASYPIGILKDIKIHFLHYNSKEEAIQKWETRKRRMNYDNLFIIFTDRNFVTYDNLVDFDKLGFDNKVVFTHKSYPEIKSSFYIKGFEESSGVGDLFSLMPDKLGMKYYDQYNYVKWFNKVSEE